MKLSPMDHGNLELESEIVGLRQVQAIVNDASIETPLLVEQFSENTVQVSNDRPQGGRWYIEIMQDDERHCAVGNRIICTQNLHEVAR